MKIKSRRDRLFWEMKNNVRNPRAFDRATDEWDLHEGWRKVGLVAIALCILAAIGVVTFLVIK